MLMAQRNCENRINTEGSEGTENHKTIFYSSEHAQAPFLSKRKEWKSRRILTWAQRAIFFGVRWSVKPRRALGWPNYPPSSPPRPVKSHWHALRVPNAY